MVPFVGDDGGGGVPGLELPPSTLAEGGKGPPGLQKRDLHLQRSLRTHPDEPQMEPGSGA